MKLVDLVDDRPTPQLAMRVATAACTQGLSSAQAYAVVAKARPEDRWLKASWPSIWSRCRSASSGSAQAGNRMALQHARRLVAAVLSPVDHPGKGTPGARRLTAIVGVRLVEHDPAFRSLQISAATLSVLMGKTGAAIPALRAAEGCGWISRESRGRGNAPILKLRPRAFAWDAELVDAVDDLLECTQTSPVAAVLRSAEHPVWDALGPTAWTAALEATVPQRELLGAAARRRERARLGELGFPVLDAEAIPAWCDRVAEAEGAMERRRELELEREQARVERMDSLATVKATRALVPPAPKNKKKLPGYFYEMFTLMQQQPQNAPEVRKTMLRRVAKWHGDDALVERLWVEWLARMWAEKAPLPEGVEDAGRERARRAAVVPLVVATVLGETPQVDPRMQAHVEAGVEWVQRKDGA
ncbi:hypothetical protein AAEX63_01780 [Luteococcus sp. H138]|uniref:hypothetical protein n=1 Tax=Luteococcus sp. H138 TaxID=3139404 RepID=UPI00313D04A0